PVPCPLAADNTPRRCKGPSRAEDGGASITARSIAVPQRTEPRTPSPRRGPRQLADAGRQPDGRTTVARTDPAAYRNKGDSNAQDHRRAHRRGRHLGKEAGRLDAQ